MRRRNMFGFQFFTVLFLACVAAPGDAPEPRSALEHLRAMEPPVFRDGHTLPPLSRWGWSERIPFDLRVTLTEEWGYALETGDVRNVARDLDQPDSVIGRVLALHRSDPVRYPLSVVLNHPLSIAYGESMPENLREQLWVRDAEGELIDGKRVWSPAVPDAPIQALADILAAPVARVSESVPIALILDGGESGLGVYGHHGKVWERDPRVLQAKGERSWYDFISERKANEQLILTRAMRVAAPNRGLYVHYTTSGGTHDYRYGHWRNWSASDYRFFRSTSDIANSEAYYRHYNTGWTGTNTLLTQALNAVGTQIAYGDDLSYNWVCSGWRRGDGVYGDLTRYEGFLKCYYTGGMIGGVAGYFSVPEGGFAGRFDTPPQFLMQMVVLARVHALFSHVEAYLRGGYLLPGPERHVWKRHQPAYEFPTGDPDVRVLARRKRLHPEWLITAWAAGGEAREATVTIPELGEIRLHATPDASVYTATRVNGEAVLDAVNPR